MMNRLSTLRIPRSAPLRLLVLIAMLLVLTPQAIRDSDPAPAAAAIGPAFLVKDINTEQVFVPQDPNQFVDVNGVLYFSGSDPTNGRELWKSDGTNAGTVMVRDIRPGTGDSSPSRLTSFLGVVFFSACTSSHGCELWKSDGTTAGTVLVKDINAGSAGSNISPITILGSKMYFAASDGINGNELWVSDGTTGGTTLLKDINPGIADSNPGSFAISDGKVYFSARTAANGTELWVTDGNTANTLMVKDICTTPNAAASSGAVNLVSSGTNINPFILFGSTDCTLGFELWRSNGTITGTFLVKDILTGASGSLNGGFERANLPAGLNHYFAADDGSGVHGTELWKTGGISTTTVLIKDILTGTASSNPKDLTFFSSTSAFFTASNVAGDGNRELWITDGTAGGTTMVKEIRAGNTGSFPRELTVFSPTLLLFNATDGFGAELWRSDGTPGGTTRVKDIFPGSTSSFPSGLTISNGSLFFGATDDTTLSTQALYKSDGTSAGTIRVGHFTSAGSDPTFLYPTSTGVVLQANQKRFNSEPWKSDATAAGTQLIKEIGSGDNASNPYAFTQLGPNILFAANDASTNYEPWRTDLTTGGTVLVTDILSGNGGLDTSETKFIELNGLLYFHGYTDVSGELFRTDGTATGTISVTNFGLLGGAFGSYASQFVRLGNSLIFAAETITSGEELWKSDGTLAGTVLVKDINTGSNGSSLDKFTVAGNRIFFFAHTPATGLELWTSDGTESGTTLVKDIRPGANTSNPDILTAVGNNVFFTANDGTGTGSELWFSDGTAAGTSLVKDIYPGNTDSAIGEIVAFRNLAFFSATDPVNGRELWKSDGTAAGTIPVKDVVAGPDGSDPQFLTVVKPNLLLFAATDGTNGLELFQTDGTAAGTFMTQDLNTGNASSTPQNFVRSGNTVYFSADDGTNGRELWAIVVNALPTAANGSLSVALPDAKTGTLGGADADSDTLTFTIVAQPTKGTVVLTNAATGAFTYTPNSGESGADSFTFKVNDGIGDSNVATVSVELVGGKVIQLPAVQVNVTLQ